MDLMEMYDVLIGDRQFRVGGCKIPEPEVAASVASRWPVYGDTPHTPLVPREEWAKLVPDDADDWSPWLPEVRDQKQVGLCNAAATCTAMEYVRLMLGMPPVYLSGADLYKRINGGIDEGSLLEDGLREATTNGICTVAECPYLDWESRATSAAVEARKSHRVIEAYACPTFAHVYSASLYGFAVISGIMWYERFALDSRYWLPARGSGRPGGHAIMGYKPTRLGSRFGLWHQNSWTERYGKQGRFVIPEECYSGPVGGWWAVRVVVQQDGSFPQPKPETQRPMLLSYDRPSSAVYRHAA